MTEAEIDAVVDALLAHVKSELAPVVARLEVLERRTETAPSVRFVGPWRDQGYPAGAACVRNGSLWIAERPTTPSDIPGVLDDDAAGPWRLAAKAGKDAGRKLERMAGDFETRIRRLEQRV